MLHPKVALLKHEILDKVPYNMFVVLCGSIIGDFYNTINYCSKNRLEYASGVSEFFLWKLTVDY